MADGTTIVKVFSGPVGATGPQGLQGPIGPQGAAGATGATGLIAAYTAFPVSPVDGQLFHHLTFRCDFQYVGSRAAWFQYGIGTFDATDGFPASPVTNLVVYRSDLRCCYVYTGTAWAVQTSEAVQSASGAPGQSLTASFVDLTGSSITFTTNGAATLVIGGWVRANGTGNCIVAVVVNGSAQVSQPVGQATDITIPVQYALAVAAGSQTTKIQVKETVAGSVVSSFYYSVQIVR